MVALEIKKLQREFLWSGFGERKRDHLVGWDLMCKPTSDGGLGLGRIFLTTKMLLGKWLWKFPRESNVLV